ncbi:MAG: hypothetical protein K6E13_04790 [Lachnospiraceae bacterium]|nr:hypothetical protein [Lachnospiraceae bacterium]
MSAWLSELKKRKKELQYAMEKAVKFLESAPEGKLRSTHCRGYDQFYVVKAEYGRNGKYISKKEIGVLSKYVQKEYAIGFIEEVKEEIAMIDRLLLFEKTNSPEETYKKICEAKRKYVNRLLCDDKSRVEEWLNKEEKRSEYKADELIFRTKNGEFVRSKSEMLLADMYYDLGIPYKYERELILKNKKKKYPDFTLYDIENKRLIYHEHFGMWDNEEYRNANLRKIKEYEENGIYVGKNLIYTFETAQNPIDISVARQNIKELFVVKNGR